MVLLALFAMFVKLHVLKVELIDILKIRSYIQKPNIHWLKNQKFPRFHFQRIQKSSRRKSSLIFYNFVPDTNNHVGGADGLVHERLGADL